MDGHGSTAAAHVQKRPVWRGSVSRAIGPKEANAAASATLEVPTFAEASKEWLVTLAIWVSTFAGNTISRNPKLAATASPMLVQRSSVATIEPGAISTEHLSMRLITSSTVAREEQPNPIETC
jgi:hypothetical protein